MSRCFFLVLALPLLGCGELIGADDYETAPPGSVYRDPADVLPAACRPCVEEYCPSQLQACASDAECDAASRCAFGSVNPGKLVECSAAHPEGALAATAFATCAENACVDCLAEQAWSCVGNYVWPEPEDNSVSIEEQVLDYVKNTPIPGVLVRVCDRRVPDCDPALGGQFDQQTTDEQGWVSLTVPMLYKKGFGSGSNGFDGFLLVEGDGLRPNYRYTSLPAVRGHKSAFTIASEEATAALGKTAGLELDPTRGILIGEMRNCFHTRPAGVRLEVDSADAATDAFYLVVGLPSAKQKETTINGIGGFTNLPPGPATVVAIEASTGKEIARSTVHVHASATTTVLLQPAP